LLSNIAAADATVLTAMDDHAWGRRSSIQHSADFSAKSETAIGDHPPACRNSAQHCPGVFLLKLKLLSMIIRQPVETLCNIVQEFFC
jgi:hypothetical protein